MPNHKRSHPSIFSVNYDSQSEPPPSIFPPPPPIEQRPLSMQQYPPPQLPAFQPPPTFQTTHHPLPPTTHELPVFLYWSKHGPEQDNPERTGVCYSDVLGLGIEKVSLCTYRNLLGIYNKISNIWNKIWKIMVSSTKQHLKMKLRI